MRRALRALEDNSPGAIGLVECQLLGALMICPLLRLDCGTLRPTDFSSSHRGAAFAAIMLERHPEAALVANRLYHEKQPPPENCTGWADAIGRLLDVAFVEDDAIGEAVRVIKEAARARRLEAIMGRSSGGPD